MVCGHLVNLGIQYLPQKLQDVVYNFICVKDILPETTRMVKEHAQKKTSWSAILLLQGLLADNILLFALMEQRWHVDYGLDPRHTMLVVPF